MTTTITDEQGNEIQPFYTSPTKPIIKKSRKVHIETAGGGYISPLQLGIQVDMKAFALTEGTYTLTEPEGKHQLIVEGGQAVIYTYEGYVPATFINPRKAGWVKGEILPLKD